MVCYANRKFAAPQRWLVRSAERFGFDEIRAYQPRDLQRTAFFRQHREILKLSRGAGYWLWKPYYILQTLRETVAWRHRRLYRFGHRNHCRSKAGSRHLQKRQRHHAVSGARRLQHHLDEAQLHGRNELRRAALSPGATSGRRFPALPALSGDGRISEHVVGLLLPGTVADRCARSAGHGELSGV